MIDTQTEQVILCLACHNPVQQKHGKRARLYCNDVCKTTFHRRKEREEEQSARLDRWNDYLPETRHALETAQHHSAELAKLFEETINAESGHYAAQSAISDLAQARIDALEQEMARYRQIVNLDNRSELVEQMMLWGERLNYRRLIAYNIKSGPDEWRTFIDLADEELLAQAIMTAKRFYEGLTLQESDANEARIAELEDENRKLQERLNVDHRYHMDTEARHFKAWLKKQGSHPVGSFAQRFLADTRFKPQASRAKFEADLKASGYSEQDIQTFRDLWKAMLLQS